ncbi:von Willebrand factor D and EGF domain-containing protein-like [Scaptodrosophila lebanonensis]|uniref:von Willebrand factor D and EGF domain-containing protein-like n=1 Tax=Drosophila lebanonensis TaxID=7225 RepID=A0A6J2TNP1_DROLE|nr:von Willebrand factor D and EGF domain-containing protein-like [Scaptodrosophila lebanonensis]
MVNKDGRLVTEWRLEGDWQNKTVLQWGFRDICCEGYMGSIDNCQPQCDNCPANSYCAAPDRCECNSGYEYIGVRIDSVVCAASCQSCGRNTHCVEPERCLCDEGYVRSSAENSADCEPVCVQACPEFSHCGRPNTCVCNAGYTAHENGTCGPMCSSDCGPHGYCRAPGKCGCLFGYHYETPGSSQCVAKCDEKCERNANCVEPNRCECKAGYNLTEQASGGLSCEPICGTTCINARCSAPETCTCHKGYKRVNKYHCIPICHHCNGGDCVAPDNCTCWEGFLPKFETKKIKRKDVIIQTCHPDKNVLIPPWNCITRCLCLQKLEPEREGEPKTENTTHSKLQSVSNNTARCVDACDKGLKKSKDPACLNTKLCECNQLSWNLICHGKSKSPRYTRFSCSVLAPSPDLSPKTRSLKKDTPVQWEDYARGVLLAMFITLVFIGSGIFFASRRHFPPVER